MGQFKPMVKMETTEPSVELKLKKGGKVAKKADGGMMGSPMAAADIPPAMPARGGMPMAGAPMKPSLAMRRRAMKGMPAGAGPAGPVGGAAAMQPPMPMPPSGPTMKKGGKAEGGKADMSQDKAMIKKAFKQHDMQEHKGAKGTKLALKKGGKMATGGVVNGQGGYKKGGKVKMAKGGVAGDGIINTEDQGGEYRNTKMDTAKPDHSPAKTGGVKLGNGGGFATGGVAKSNGGGYKKGGATKKHFATGGSVNSTGSAVAMPQGRKPAAKPVAINELAGTYKRGGRVAPGNRELQAVSQKENAPAMRGAKAMSNEKYGPASLMKLKGGGDVDLSKGAYDKAIGPSEDDMDMARSIRGFPGKVFDKVKGAAKELFSTMPKTDSVTKTKESVTVTPAKKRGGSVKC
jgi:hypothetical protein